ncbi:MAG: glutathione synthase, partial [Betaproteobacteria bacterium]
MAQGLSLLFILDPLGELKAYKDSSVAMMREAARRGHDVWACLQPALRWRDGRVTATAHRLELRADDHDWYRVVETGSHDLSSFDAVLMRKDPPFDLEYVYSTYLLEHAVREGARVFNDPRAVRDHGEKYAIAEFPEFTADTMVTRDPARLRQFVQKHGEAVFKLLDGMGGASIFRARAGDPNLSVIVETMNQFGARSVMAQR